MPQLTIPQALAMAVQHHQSGRLAEAEGIYRQILAHAPDHAGALHLLGVLSAQTGRNDAAVELIRKSIAVEPRFPLAHNNLGNALSGAGLAEEAIAAYRQAIALDANYAEALSNLGAALRDRGRLDEAIAAYERAITLRPGDPETYNNLGNALSDKGLLDEAIAAYGRAIAIKPRYPEAHNNLGNALQARGKTQEAIGAYRQAIALAPGLGKAHRDLGAALHVLGRPEEAMAAYRRSLEIEAGDAKTHYNLGNALRETGRPEEAVASYRQAIALEADYPEAHNNLAVALSDQGRLDEALAAFRKALSLKPSYCEAHSNLIYTLHFHPDYDMRAMAEEHRCWNQMHAEPLRKFILPHGNDRSAERRIRIGYVSPEFRDHVIGRNLLPLFRRHNRAAFEITCYAGVPHPDAITEQFQQNADRWRNIVGLSDERIAEQIRADGIDVLVDLTMHMGQNYLLVFARKPAPVQVTFAGYPGSTGLTAIDYRLSDPYLDPPGMDESVYSERTVRLPASFWCYDPLDCRDVRVNGLPVLVSGRVTFGCLNNFCKVNEGTLALWARVLGQVEGSRLMLLAKPGGHRQRTAEFLASQGVAAGRVEFLEPRPRHEYLELYHRIDLGLDSFPYNGHTTSLDSLWMGVPVVTMVGGTVAGRAGWSQLSNLGLRELAGETPEQFVEIAVGLANDRPRLSELRATLRQRMEGSALMDAAGLRGIEAACRGMWRAWCAGERASGC